MPRFKTHIEWVVLCMGGLLFAQVTFQADIDRKTLSLGECVTINFRLFPIDAQEQINRPDFPEFDGFVVKEGWETREAVLINNKFFYTVVYVVKLTPLRIGDLFIDKARIEINGRKYETGLIPLRVDSHLKDSSRSKKRDFYLEVFPSITEAYINQQMVLSLKLCAADKFSVENVAELSFPDLDEFIHFWKCSDPFASTSQKLCQELYKGRKYFTQTLCRIVLIPQKKGWLKVGPFTAKTTVYLPTGRYDLFGEPIFEFRRLRLSSHPFKIKVKNLPEYGKPPGFSGIVGSFTMDVHLDTDRWMSDELVELKIEIRGKGPLRAIEIPSPSFLDHIEVYEPTREEDIRIASEGLEGKVAARYLFIPQHDQRLYIPPLRFSFFDPDKNRYITLESNPIDRKIESPVSPSPRPDIHSDRPKEPEESVRNKGDLLEDQEKPVRNKSFQDLAMIFYLLMGVILLVLLLLGSVLWIKFKPRRDYKSVQKNQRELIAQQLQYAALAAKEADKLRFYAHLEEALSLFIMDIAGLGRADLRQKAIQRFFDKRRISSAASGRLLELLQTCQRAKYASQEGDEKPMEDLLEETRIVFEALSK